MTCANCDRSAGKADGGLSVEPALVRRGGSRRRYEQIFETISPVFQGGRDNEEFENTRGENQAKKVSHSQRSC